jgi:hypothetical protein
VIERDATWCKIVGETASTTGIKVHPNPHASLYVHVLDEPGPSQRDVDVISLGIARFVHLMPLFFQEGVHERWTTSARELIRVVDADRPGRSPGARGHRAHRGSEGRAVGQHRDVSRRRRPFRTRPARDS